MNIENLFIFLSPTSFHNYILINYKPYLPDTHLKSIYTPGSSQMVVYNHKSKRKKVSLKCLKWWVLCCNPRKRNRQHQTWITFCLCFHVVGALSLSEKVMSLIMCSMCVSVLNIFPKIHCKSHRGDIKSFIKVLLFNIFG